MAQDSEKKSVLFVCMGNICRSTMAEGVFKFLTNPGSDSPYANYISRVDSCGTGAWHVGEDADERTLETLQKHGITDYHNRARKIRASDFEEFDYIFGMDNGNMDNIRRLQTNNGGARVGKAQVMLFGEYSGTGKREIINDPYYGGVHGFEKAYQQARRYSLNFLRDTFPDVPGADGFAKRIESQ